MRTLPPAARCRCPARRRRGRRSRYRSGCGSRRDRTPPPSPACRWNARRIVRRLRSGRRGRRRGACWLQRAGADRRWCRPTNTSAATRRASLVTTTASPRADRHVLLRPVFQVVARGHDVVRRGEPQIVPGHHQHGLIDVVDRDVALRLVGRGEDAAHAPRPAGGRSRCRRCRCRRPTRRPPPPPAAPAAVAPGCPARLR